MSKEISTKNFVLVLIDGGRFFLDEAEAEKVKQAIRAEIKFIEIGNSIIMTSGISRLVSGVNYEEAEKIKRGDWKCKYGFWHQKWEQCAHGEFKKYEK